MLEAYETLTTQQKNYFADVCSKLLSSTYLARDKRDNKEAYYFVISYKDLFEEYFKIMNFGIEVNRDLGTVVLISNTPSTTLKLKKEESVLLLIIRLLYHEKLKETTLNNNITITINDLHDRYDMLEMRKKMPKTELVSIIRLFRKYNLVEPVGDLNNSNTQIIIFPTILEALKTSEIETIFNTINRIVGEGGEENEKVD